MKVAYTDIGPLADNSAPTIYQTIVVPAKDALKQVRQALGGNLTLRDNQYAAVMSFGYGINNSTVTLVSGTEYTFANPLKTKPIGFTPLICTNTVGVPVTVESFKLNTTRTDGLMGITATQDMQHTAPFLFKSATGAMSIGNNTDTLMTDWNSSLKIRGTSVTEASGVITISETGSYHFISTCRLAASATYSSVQLSIRQNNVNSIGNQYLPVAFTDGPIFQVAAILQANASDTFGMYIYQTNAASATRNVLGTFRNLAIHRLYNDTTPAMIVSGILWGG